MPWRIAQPHHGGVVCCHRQTSSRSSGSSVLLALQSAPVVEGVSACGDIPLPGRIDEGAEAPMLPLDKEIVNVCVSLQCASRYAERLCGLPGRQPPLFNK